MKESRMNFFRKTAPLVAAGSFVLLAATHLFAAALEQCHVLQCPVGLVVRAAPTSDSARLGSIADGKKVKLDGRMIKNSSKVDAITAEDLDGATWIKIKEPMRGYVLYEYGDGNGTEEDRTLRPCGQ